MNTTSRFVKGVLIGLLLSVPAWIGIAVAVAWFINRQCIAS